MELSDPVIVPTINLTLRDSIMTLICYHPVKGKKRKDADTDTILGIINTHISPYNKVLVKEKMAQKDLELMKEIYNKKLTGDVSIKIGDLTSRMIKWLKELKKETGTPCQDPAANILHKKKRIQKENEKLGPIFNISKDKTRKSNPANLLDNIGEPKLANWNSPIFADSFQNPATQIKKGQLVNTQNIAKKTAEKIDASAQGNTINLFKVHLAVLSEILIVWL